MKIRKFGVLIGVVLGPVITTIPSSPASAAGTPMLITIDLRLGDANTTLRLPLQNGTQATEFDVNWDVGNQSPTCAAEQVTVAGGGDNLVDEVIECTYVAADVTNSPVKTISITPTGVNTIERFGWDDVITGADKYTGVTQWGDLGLQSLSGAFRGMTNFVDVPTVVPNTVTNLSSAFSRASTFNDVDIASWTTSAVTNMSAMFSQATAFNRDISTWDTSSVTDMSGMFSRATSFNRSLNTWDTSSVANMTYMFYGATSFNGAINLWDVSNVGGFGMMFADAMSFNQPIGTWNTISATHIGGMFQGATTFNQNLSSWKTLNVTTMSYMFAGATSFNGALASTATTWNPSNVTDMTSMFAGATAFNQSLSSWTGRVGSVQLMTNMFRGATAFNNGKTAGDCDGELAWGTSSLTDASGMFADTLAFDQRVALDTTDVTSMAEMFQGALGYNNGCYVPQVIIAPSEVHPQVVLNWVDLELDTSNVTSFRDMFHGAVTFNRNVNALNTSSATTVDRMFKGALAFNNGCNPGVAGGCPLTFDISATPKSFGAVTSMVSMFNGAVGFNQNLDSLDTSTVTNMHTVFYSAGSFNNGCPANDVTCPLDWDVSNVTLFTETFDGAGAFDQDISGWNVRKATSMDRMFQTALVFDQDLSGWCFDGAVTHVDFETSAGFDGQAAKLPSFTTCPQQIVFVPFQPVLATPPTTSQPPAVEEPLLGDPDAVEPAPVITLPETGRSKSALPVAALWVMVLAALVFASRGLVGARR